MAFQLCKRFRFFLISSKVFLVFPENLVVPAISAAYQWQAKMENLDLKVPRAPQVCVLPVC